MLKNLNKIIKVALFLVSFKLAAKIQGVPWPIPKIFWPMLIFGKPLCFEDTE